MILTVADLDGILCAAGRARSATEIQDHPLVSTNNGVDTVRVETRPVIDDAAILGINDYDRCC